MDEGRGSSRGYQGVSRRRVLARRLGARVGLLSMLGLSGQCAGPAAAHAEGLEAGAPEQGCAAQGGSTQPRVRVRQGWLQGTRSDGVDRFLAIPYAAPPVGEGRWRPPQAPSSWRGVRAADTAPPHCPQVGGGGQEDCLYLSVLRPTHRRRSGPLPVLFFIHGGSFKVGSGLDNDPTRIARDSETIVVMINYRLGQLGFLAHPALSAEADGLSGQYGLMDQQAALRWVHDNIPAFGGDAERITIAGGSAGGMSVCAHVASPGVAGLFAGGVIMSGGCFAVGIDEAEGFGVTFATNAGCPDTASAACLRSKSAEELTAADSFANPSIVVWGGSLLPEPPADAIAAGRAAHVPVMIGGAEHESRAGARLLFPRAEADYIAGVRDFFGEDADAVLEHYPAQAYDDPFYAETDMVDDSGINLAGPCLDRQTAQALSTYAPVYFYEFADDDAPMPAWAAVDAPPGFHLGASHGSDEVYWFDRPQDNVAPLSEAQQALAATMIQLLGRFVRSGAPSGQRPGAFWPRYDAAHERVLRFEPGATAVTEAWATRHQCEFWRSLGY